MKAQIIVVNTNDEVTIGANGYAKKTYNVPKNGYKLIMVSFRYTGGGDSRRFLLKSLYLTGTDSFDATWQNLDNINGIVGVGYYLVYSKL